MTAGYGDLPGWTDPTVPLTSRFPLSSGTGPFVASSERPSESSKRPFGMRFGVRPVELGEHEKKPTQKSKSKPTQITNDGPVVGADELTSGL